MEQIQQTLQSVIQNVFGVDVAADISRPDPQFGDYATNVALQLAGRLKRNPREVAEELAAKLREALGDQVRDVSVAGPGFINLALSDQALAELAQRAPTFRPSTYEGKVVMVEYSDPNPFKPLHAGHLYTTLVGDTIARLVENAGAKTIRANYGGDVGRHVGISMWAIVRWLGGEHPEKLADIPEAERPAWMGARYVEGTAAFEDDESVKPEIIAANKRVYQLHADGDHDSPFAQIYWTVRGWSYDYFKVLYDQLQVVPFDRFFPESEIVPLGVQTAEDLLAKGILERSDGAVVYHGEQDGLHTRVFINSQGVPTYEAKELGLALTKWRDYHFDQSFIITASEQDQFMQVVLAVLRKVEPEYVERTHHVNHGMVKLQGGTKMSSRKGNIVTALQILAAAREAGAATGTNPSEETILAAVKYAFAKNRIGADVIYDPQESVALEGNSGPYLQYAHARARSILAKAEGAERQLGDDMDEAERSLARKIGEYPEVLERAVAEILPHYICTYIYELSQEFNRFYEKSKVVGDPREKIRLKLVELYADTLKDGLTLLGITAPSRL